MASNLKYPYNLILDIFDFGNYRIKTVKDLEDGIRTGTLGLYNTKGYPAFDHFPRNIDHIMDTIIEELSVSRKKSAEILMYRYKYDSGARPSYAKVGEKFSVSASYIRFNIGQSMNFIKRSCNAVARILYGEDVVNRTDELNSFGLSVRAFNSIKRYNMHSRPDVLEYIRKNGYTNVSDLTHIRNVGIMTAREINSKLNLELIDEPVADHDDYDEYESVMEAAILLKKYCNETRCGNCKFFIKSGNRCKIHNDKVPKYWEV